MVEEFRYDINFCVEIEQQVREMQAKKAAASSEDGEEGRISLNKANMDSDIYGDVRVAGNYHTSISAADDGDDVSFFFYKTCFGC